MKYFKTVIIVIIAIFCLSITTHKNLYASEFSQGNSAGGEAGSSILSEIGSGDQINQRMGVPLTSSTTKMKTFGQEDQKEEFEAQMSAPSSDAFFVLFVQPSATGDLSTVEVRQDLDYDGNPDYVYTLPFSVSGVCANGVISCTSGTWSDCRYFTWATDNDGKVGLNEEASIVGLAGCYCINSSCGSDLVWNNLNVVLKDMGGAAVASVQNNDPHLAITSVKTSDNAIYYYGQKTFELGTASQGEQNYLSGSVTPENYYGGNIPTDDEVFRQDQDPNSYYSQLVNSSAAQDSSVSTYTCTARHDIIVTQEMCDEVIEQGDVHYWIQVCANCGMFSSTCRQVGCSNRNGFTPCNTGFLMWNFGPPPPAAAVLAAVLTYSCESAGNSGWTELGYVYGWYDQVTVYTCSLAALPRPSYATTYLCQPDCQTQSLTFNNQCNPAPDCRLKEEKVCDDNGEKCVQTWRNFSPTGLAPMPYCKNIAAIGHTYTACMDGSSATIFKDEDPGQVLGSGENIWWHIERTYQCETDNDYDFENLKQRTQHISDTTQDDTSSMYYEDYDPDTGIVEGHTTELFDRGDFDTCEKGCKVRRIVQDTQATISGTTADYRDSVSSYEDVYRTCVNGSCPVSADETILVDCTCINEFSKAISLMQVMDDASHDMICSDD